MFLTRRRIALFGAIAALVITIIFLPRIQYYVNAPDANAIDIDLSDIKMANVKGTNNIELTIFFNIHNPSDKTATTSKIEYDLFANDQFVGSNVLSYEDIPLNGRPQFTPGDNITLKSPFLVQISEKNAEITDTLKSNSSDLLKTIKWHVNGTSQIESAFVTVVKKFSDDL